LWACGILPHRSKHEHMGLLDDYSKKPGSMRK